MSTAKQIMRGEICKYLFKWNTEFFHGNILTRFVLTLQEYSRKLIYWEAA